MKNKVAYMLKNRDGFSLVELIVVIAIMVILVAMLLPHAAGYLIQAKEVTLKNDAKQIYAATQSALIDVMVEQPEVYKESFQFSMPDGKGGTKKVGRVSNFAFSYSQDNNGVSNPGETTSADQAIARGVLEMMGWQDANTARYPFKVQRNPVGRNVNDYYKETKQPGFMVVYNTNGTLEFIEWGEGGYLVRVDQGGGNVELIKNGSFSNFAGW